jgi:SPP1 family predicted phage head-tail adaptor
VGIAAGQLKKRVQVQVLQAAPADLALRDPYNAPPPPEKDSSWQTVCTHWASVEPISGKELFQAQQVRSDATHKVVMRYFKNARIFVLKPGVDPSMRLVLQQHRILNVLSCVNSKEQDRWLELLCVEEV